MTASRPFERITTDIYGPFPITDFKSENLRETGYILTITDVFTRYTKLHFSERINADIVIKELESWCANFSKPEIMISDNGKQYVNAKLERYLKIKDIKHLFIPEYTPSSNGISERLNKTISFILTINKDKYINEAVNLAKDNQHKLQ
ncbi:hypothetical protein NGRA_2646 [Nosema granulosis]|uniref:Integrase catalytic domain-containing protein n=1 Tax=Nosema granulosis TaxID=83296 RepID=A0A9P6GWA3_9MICR|nr:hypothetical protein NGRA_2646 [Nosema granulosis]